MDWVLKNGGTEEGKYTEKELMDMILARDPKINRISLVNTQIDQSEWKTIAQTEELDAVRRQLYPDSEKLVWPKPPSQTKRSGVLLSFLLPGLGQLYLGQTAKGFSTMVATIILSILTYGVAGFVLWIAGMVDTNKLQNTLKVGQPIKQWEFF